jgi:sortase A
VFPATAGRGPDWDADRVAPVFPPVGGTALETPPAFPPAAGGDGDAFPADILGGPEQPYTPLPPPAWKPLGLEEGNAYRGGRGRGGRQRGSVLVGVIGEVLITLGVLLGLYVVWELVWTDVEANQEAQEVVEAVRAQPKWVVPAGDEFARHRDPSKEAPPVDKDPLATPPFGEAWGVLHVPRWGLDYTVPVVEGTDRVKILNKGLIGHYEGTEGPGRVGNFATSAHRTTYGKPYNRVAELQNGDSLVMETAQYYFVYKMYNYEIVYPEAVRVIWPVPNEEGAVPTQRIITLTTCHPMFSARQRYVVWGELAYWADKADGPLEELVEG